MAVGEGKPTNLAGCNDRVGRGRDGPGRQHAARDAACVLARGQEPNGLVAAASSVAARVGRRARHAAEPRAPRPAERGAGRGGRGDAGRCHANAGGGWVLLWRRRGWLAGAVVRGAGDEAESQTPGTRLLSYRLIHRLPRSARFQLPSAHGAHVALETTRPAAAGGWIEWR